MWGDFLNKEKCSSFVSKFSDSLSIIKGNAQLAIMVEDKSKWVNKYLTEISKEVDKTSALLKDATDFCQSECYSGSTTSGNSPYKKLT